MKSVIKNTFLFALSLILSSCSQFSEPQGLSGVAPGTKANQKLGPNGQLEPTFASIKETILDKKCISCHNPNGEKEAKDIPLETEADVVKGTSGSGELILPGDPSNSVFYRSMVTYESIRKKTKLMPPTKSRHEAVTADELLAVAAWISSLPQSSSGENPVPDPGTGTVSPGACTPGAGSSEPLIPEPAVIDFAFIKTQILDKKCLECHKADGKADEMIFGSREELIKQTNEFSQAVLVPGKPESSLLYLSILKSKPARRDARFMPPRKELNEGLIKDITLQEIGLIKKWIEEGAR